MAASVLFLHGIRTSRTMWRHQVEAVQAAGFPALAVDLPGHGERESEEFSLEAAAHTIERAVRQLPSPTVVVGLSLGGYLALHWAARTDVPPAAILAASCSTRPLAVPLTGYRSVAALMARLPDRGLRFHHAMANAALSAQGVEDVNAGGVALGVMVPALRAMALADPLGDLRAITAPVWLVNGAWDHFRVEERRFLAAAQHGRLVVIPRARHLVSLDAPVAFSRVVTEVLNTVADDLRTPGGSRPALHR